MRPGANRRDHVNRRRSPISYEKYVCFNEARRESPGSRTRYRVPHPKQLRSTLRALAERSRCNT